MLRTAGHRDTKLTIFRAFSGRSTSSPLSFTAEGFTKYHGFQARTRKSQ
ncbi:MAG: hypothetical protein PHW56_08195 [Methanosarcinaceae archaeon]|nr:hypothetical protein [Methanosarcinaceae archaeon]